MSVRDSQGNQRLFIFVTSVDLDLLDPRMRGLSVSPSYRMAAMEVQLVNGDLVIQNIASIGTQINKDTWVMNIVPSEAQRQQMRRIAEVLHLDMALNSRYPVLVSTRIRGRTQNIPLDSLERVFSLTPTDWERITNCSGCYDSSLTPDLTNYRSLGNNDQPQPVSSTATAALAPELERLGVTGPLRWHFYHQTGSTNNSPYSTWVRLLNSSGEAIYSLPYAIEMPSHPYYREGDIPWVVFNSSNIIQGGQIFHINGAADSGVMTSRTDEARLLREILRYPVIRRPP
jgi:hypothetical protein